MIQSKISELTSQVLSLPVEERLRIAQRLWESLDESERAASISGEEAVLTEAKRRHAELAAGTVVGRSHEEVMEAARRALECE